MLPIERVAVPSISVMSIVLVFASSAIRICTFNLIDSGTESALPSTNK